VGRGLIQVTLEIKEALTLGCQGTAAAEATQGGLCAGMLGPS
jgi:hypothetical protein